MRITFLLLSVFWTILSTAQVETIDCKWLVILSGFDNIDNANQANEELDPRTIILNSGDYDNLNPGWFINCIPFDSKGAAKIESKKLTDDGFKNYIKYSGKFKNVDSYLVENHFQIFGGKYLITDYKINSDDIMSISGCDIVGAAYVAQANIDINSLPDSFKYLKGKEMTVYDINGNRTSAKVSGFKAVNISIPYWGFVVQWQQENTSDVEIAKNLIGTGELTLVATIDLPEGFNGIISHLKTDHFLSIDNNFNNDKIINQAYQKINNLDIIKECYSLMTKSMKEDYAGYQDENFPIVKQAKGLNVGDSSYVFVNIVYGDYCDNQKYGYFYSNIFAVWNTQTNDIEVINDFNESSQFEYTPFFVSANGKRIIGFVTDNYSGINTYFKYHNWKNLKYLDIGAHDCD